MSDFIIADDHSDDEFAPAPAPISDAPIVLGAPAGGDDDLFGGLSEEKPVANEFGEDKPVVDEFSSALGDEFGAPVAPAVPMDPGDLGFSFVSEESPLR